MKSVSGDLKNYILKNEDDYLFSSITASYKSEPIFEPFQNVADGAIGVLKLRLGDELVINDGQHRAVGITAAVRENPKIGEHTISVLLFPWETKDRVQQMFSDLNRYVQKTSKSLDILFDQRDDYAMATRAFLDRMPLLKGHGLASVSWRGERLGSGYRIDGILSSCFEIFFGSVPGEPFFRPGPHDAAAVARSGGQGRPRLAAARRACP